MTDPSEIEPSMFASSSRLQLRVTGDGMRAFASVNEGAPREPADLEAALQAVGIVHGIDPAASVALVVALARPEATAMEIEIARGTAAGQSRDGWFEPAFQPGIQPGHLRQDGTLNFHDRELLKPMSIGEMLGRLHRPIDGAPGLRIDGAPIAAQPGRNLDLQVGPGAELLADGRVRVTSPGVAIYVEGRSIEIGTHYVHEGDVDLHSGDLSMEGSLVVRSDVQRGFAARATGNLEIRGGVEGGSAYAGANLRVFGGVRGGEGSLVAAGGDLFARHVERARLDSGGVLELGDAVNSELSAVQARIAGTLRGGRAAVEVGLVTRDAGTKTATVDTVIEAGVPREDAEADARHLIEAAKAQRMGARRTAGSGKIADRGKGGKLARELLDVQRGVLLRKIQRAERMAALLPHAFVEVRGTAHPGVHVRIGEARLLLQDTMRQVRFTLDLERRTIRTEGIPK
jgi:uncharacterized protein (DUF342 family)